MVGGSLNPLRSLVAADSPWELVSSPLVLNQIQVVVGIPWEAVSNP